MLQKMIDDIKDSTGNAVRLTSLAMTAAVFLFITVGGRYAAEFLFQLHHYGMLYDGLAGAGVYSVFALSDLAFYAVRKRRSPPPMPPEEENSAF